MLPIHFAPLQGHTDDAFRRIHHQLVGGVTSYYTPFIRLENGKLRSKEIRDIKPEWNAGVPVIPQVMAGDSKEFRLLVDNIAELGNYEHIDINMGCPFPLQTRHGKGSGILSHPDEGNYTDTAITRVKRYLYEKGEYNPDNEISFAPALVNRIDRNTCGIIIGAKNSEALRILNEKLKNRELHKLYLCVVIGKLKKESGIIEGYLQKNEKQGDARLSYRP